MKMPGAKDLSAGQRAKAKSCMPEFAKGGYVAGNVKEASHSKGRKSDEAYKKASGGAVKLAIGGPGKIRHGVMSANGAPKSATSKSRGK